MEKQKETVIYFAPMRVPGLALEVSLVNGKMVSRVTDTEMGEEYRLHAIPGGSNAFSDLVREEVEEVLTKLREGEKKSEPTREGEVFALAKERFGTEPEYPWADSDAAVLRRGDTKKWYAVFLNVAGEKLGLTGRGVLRVVNLHADPGKVPELLLKPGHFPAFHMNKKSWVTLLLDGSVPMEDLAEELSESYRLGGKEKKKTLAK